MKYVVYLRKGVLHIMVYAITYDLNKAGQDYPRLYKTIEGMGLTIHPLQNLWFLSVSSQHNASTITDALRSVIDNNDHIFVCRVTTDWNGWMPKTAIDWLQGKI